MDITVTFAIVSVGVAGLAAVLGIWMERDHNKPPRYAYALSVLILLATLVSVFQTWLDAKAGEKMEEDMARMLQTLDKMASESDDPNLKQFLSTELAAQSRSNPEIVEKLAQRVSDEGGNPADVIGKLLPASEVNRMARSGNLKTKKPSVPQPKAAAAPVTAAPAAPKPGLKLIVPVRKGGSDTDSAAPAAAAVKPLGIKMPGLGLGGPATGAAASTDDAKPAPGGVSGLRLGGLGASKPAAPAPAKETPTTEKKEQSKKKSGLPALKL